MYCIYKITNKVNGHFYIGQHKYTDESNPMKGYFGSGMLIKQAYKKYGKENFVKEVLYKRISYKKTADAMEIWAISKYKPEYNISTGGTGGYLGEEVCKKLSEAALKKYERMREMGIKIVSGRTGRYSLEHSWNEYISYYCSERDGYRYCFNNGRRTYKKPPADEQERRNKISTKMKGHCYRNEPKQLSRYWDYWCSIFCNSLYSYRNHYGHKVVKRDIPKMYAHREKAKEYDISKKD